MKFALELIQFGEQLLAERSAASDLWSWLPSHTWSPWCFVAIATAHRPSNQDVMTEAAMYLAHLARPDEPLTTEEREWFESCPCGEEHEETAP